ncbi:MAG: divalent-cation tolerance protein CutA [Bacilli bacterium]|nr:divalent-cation tolerance protein CutA [Bacilli bacterium]
MNKYIIVTTLCNSKEIASKIVDVLLKKKLVSGSQLSNVHSKYCWNNKIEECDEYKIELRTKSNLFNKIKQEIEKIHDYEVAEISCQEILDGNLEFLKWIDENTK